MNGQSDIAIYMSIGSLVVASMSFFFTLRQSRVQRKNERIRVYDKIYHEASELLLYHYKNISTKPYTNDDKDIQRSVNEYANSHWIEQMYGHGFYIPENLTTEKERQEYINKVRDEYSKYQHDANFSGFDDFINYQSPVLHLNNDDFSQRFKRLLEHVNANLSYFSPEIIDCIEEMRLVSPDKVKNDYIALNRVNLSACESINETVDDPYLKLLLCVRSEYRKLNKTFKNKCGDILFLVKIKVYSLSRMFRRDKYLDY
ncbi:TPA: hypothetical protein ACJ2UI_000147 [Yersinia enterocolitica]